MNIIEEIKNSWGWIGIQPVAIVGENDFGNLIVKDIEGKYWRICPEDIYCKVIADNKDQLDALSRDQEFLHDWYMQVLVEQAREVLEPLAGGYKYHFVIPGILGGKYDISNIKIISLIEQIRFSGSVGQQIHDLPEGSQVRLKLVE